MTEILSLAEMKERFQSEWVLLEDPDTNSSLDVTAGKVLCHSKDRDEVYRKALELKPKHSAVIYTGTLPKDAAVVL